MRGINQCAIRHDETSLVAQSHRPTNIRTLRRSHFQTVLAEQLDVEVFGKVTVTDKCPGRRHRPRAHGRAGRMSAALDCFQGIDTW